MVWLWCKKQQVCPLWHVFKSKQASITCKASSFMHSPATLSLLCIPPCRDGLSLFTFETLYASGQTMAVLGAKCIERLFFEVINSSSTFHLIYIPTLLGGSYPMWHLELAVAFILGTRCIEAVMIWATIEVLSSCVIMFSLMEFQTLYLLANYLFRVWWRWWFSRCIHFQF